MIIIVKDIEKANFVTHAGKFHADDVFSTVLLEKIYGNITLIRLSEVDKYELGNKIVYDIGGGKFDHHQIGGNGTHQTGIKYASFGLIWNEYGLQYLKSINDLNAEETFERFKKHFVQFIDAVDNGQIPFENIDIKLETLSDVIEGFNPNWDEEIDTDIKFMEAVEIARKIFDVKITSAIAKSCAKGIVEEAIEKSENGILILNQFMPYQEFVLESSNIKAKEILYAVFKSNRGGYNVKAIPKKLGSFENRKKLPQEWAGLRNKELQEVTGVETAMFCHTACFLCVAGTLEDAIKLAKLAVRHGDRGTSF